MKHPKTYARALLLTLACVLALLVLPACSTSEWNTLSDDSDTDVLCRTFIDHVIQNEKSEVYALVKHMVSPADYEVVWKDLRAVAEGAKSADIHQTNWQFFTEDGANYFQSWYFVEYDTGASMTFSLTTGETKGVLKGMGFTETTDFAHDAEGSSKLWGTVLTVYSLLVYAFTIWMIVDCARRRVKKKPLWILLIFFGLAITVTRGPEANHVSYFIGLMLQFSTSTLDLAVPALVTRVIVPVGSVIYFFLRKRITKPAEDPLTVEATPGAPMADTYDLAEINVPAADQPAAPAPEAPAESVVEPTREIPAEPAAEPGPVANTDTPTE